MLKICLRDLLDEMADQKSAIEIPRIVRCMPNHSIYDSTADDDPNGDHFRKRNTDYGDALLPSASLPPQISGHRSADCVKVLLI